MKFLAQLAAMAVAVFTSIFADQPIKQVEPNTKFKLTQARSMEPTTVESACVGLTVTVHKVPAIANAPHADARRVIVLDTRHKFNSKPVAALPWFIQIEELEATDLFRTLFVNDSVQ